MGGAGGILRGGHVGTGQTGEFGGEGLAVVTGGDIATVDQKIGIVGEYLTPLLELVGVVGQIIPVQRPGGQADAARTAVGEQVDGAHMTRFQQGAGHLFDPIAVGIQHHHLRRFVQFADQIPITGHAGIDEQELPGLIDRRGEIILEQTAFGWFVGWRWGVAAAGIDFRLVFIDGGRQAGGIQEDARLQGHHQPLGDLRGAIEKKRSGRLAMMITVQAFHSRLLVPKTKQTPWPANGPGAKKLAKLLFLKGIYRKKAFFHDGPTHTL